MYKEEEILSDIKDTNHLLSDEEQMQILQKAIDQIIILKSSALENDSDEMGRTLLLPSFSTKEDIINLLEPYWDELTINSILSNASERSNGCYIDLNSYYMTVPKQIEELKVDRRIIPIKNAEGVDVGQTINIILSKNDREYGYGLCYDEAKECWIVQMLI